MVVAEGKGGLTVFLVGVVGEGGLDEREYGGLNPIPSALTLKP
jgi:hypothetical protein